MIFKYFLIFLICCAGIGLGIVSVYNLAIYISPGMTPEGHRVMPIGQALLGLCLGGPLGLLCAGLSYKKWHKKV